MTDHNVCLNDQDVKASFNSTFCPNKTPFVPVYVSNDAIGGGQDTQSRPVLVTYLTQPEGPAVPQVSHTPATPPWSTLPHCHTHCSIWTWAGHSCPRAGVPPQNVP